MLVIQHWQQKVGSGEEWTRRVAVGVGGGHGDGHGPHTAPVSAVGNRLDDRDERAEVCWRVVLEVEHEPAISAALRFGRKLRRDQIQQPMIPRE